MKQLASIIKNIYEQDLVFNSTGLLYVSKLLKKTQ